MKKHIHPKLEKTKIILSNGSTYNKNWLTFKKIIKLDTDISKHPLWTKKKFTKK